MPVQHGLVDVFAYQEALLVMAIFGIAILTMIWVGFRRWLQHKENMERLLAEQNAQRASLQGAQIASVQARLEAVEQVVGNGEGAMRDRLAEHPPEDRPSAMTNPTGRPASP